MRINHWISAAIVAISAASPALAEVVTFDEFPSSFQGSAPVVSGSLTFSSTSSLVGVWTSAPDIGAFNGTPYLLDYTGGLLSVSRTDSQNFTLHSFDMALGWYSSSPTANVDVTYYLAGGGTSLQTLPLTLAYQTFSPELSLSQVTFDLSTGGLGGYISLDNLNVDGAAPVPEPETYALMLAGLALVGTVARRRSR